MENDADQATREGASAAAPQDPSTRVQELEEQLARLKDERLREHAELENQRRRLLREVEQARRFANERLLADLLPVFDSLEAGLKASGEAQRLHEGIELTLRELVRVAGGHGLEAVDPVGQPFDPERHEAMSTIVAEGQAPGSVVQVYQKGYLLNERLLRPALVVVAADPAG